MNNDLISREALKKDIDNLRLFKPWVREEIKAHIDNAPTVEPEKIAIANVSFDENKLKEIVQTEVIDKINSGELVLKDERPQGEWITVKQDTMLGTFEVKNKVCNKCNHATKYEYPFCPWCGADMREGGEA